MIFLPAAFPSVLTFSRSELCACLFLFFFCFSFRAVASLPQSGGGNAAVFAEKPGKVVGIVVPDCRGDV